LFSSSGFPRITTSEGGYFLEVETLLENIKLKFTAILMTRLNIFDSTPKTIFELDTDLDDINITQENN
jgi:hypothetical protein